MNVTVTVDSQLNTRSNSGSTIEVITAPAVTNNTYAVMDNSGQCCMPALAFVFAGPSATVPVTATHFANQDTTVSYTWNVPIGSGQTVVLMHFGVQHGLTDAAGADTQAQALVNLTDPNVLNGVSATEQSEIVNFVVH